MSVMSTWTNYHLARYSYKAANLYLQCILAIPRHGSTALKIPLLIVYIVMQWTLWGEPYTMSNLTQAGALTIYKEGTKGLPGKSQADTEGWTLHVAQCRYLMVCKYYIFPFFPSFLLHQYGTYASLSILLPMW